MLHRDVVQVRVEELLCQRCSFEGLLLDSFAEICLPLSMKLEYPKGHFRLFEFLVPHKHVSRQLDRLVDARNLKFRIDIQLILQEYGLPEKEIPSWNPRRWPGHLEDVEVIREATQVFFISLRYVLIQFVFQGIIYLFHRETKFCMQKADFRDSCT